MSTRVGFAGATLVIVGLLAIGIGAVAARGGLAWSTAGPGSYAMMGGIDGMMGRLGLDTGAPGPGQPGFVAGTSADPRVVRVIAGPGYTFTPPSIVVARGETVRFEVTSMGGLVHEFMIGPADAVAADAEGTPEVADLGMMQAGSLTYTFDGPGPYAFACHAPGHYENGMAGQIVLVG